MTTGVPIPLPSYRVLLAVDAERFSRSPSARLPGLSALLPEVLENAMSACGLEEVWRGRRFAQSTGDGYVLGADPSNIPLLLHPFLDCLQEELERQDRLLRADGRDLRLRLRASIHLGPVPDSGDELRDRVSTPTNEVFRLLDAAPTRVALSRSNPDVTLLAVVISQRVFEDVVLGGYTALHPDRFEPVTAELKNKDFVYPAWLYVPNPSRRHAAPEALPRTEHQGPDSPSGPDARDVSEGGRPVGRTVITPVFRGDIGSTVIADQVHGGINPRFDGSTFGGARREDPR
jgi:hypothetical protein